MTYRTRQTLIVAGTGLVAALYMFSAGCGGAKVVRNADTFQLETMAALARQQEAALALRAAVAAATTKATCEQYAAPLVVIDAYAANQAKRALFLAGLEDEDPGPSADPVSVDTLCGELP